VVRGAERRDRDRRARDRDRRSPIPQDSFDVGKDTYWRYLADSAPEMLFGRKVCVVFRDDRHNPNGAVPVCRELVEKEKVLLLVGAGGADQTTASARYANQVGVPYLSAGGNEEGLRDLSTYDATTSATHNRRRSSSTSSGTTT